MPSSASGLAEGGCCLTTARVLSNHCLPRRRMYALLRRYGGTQAPTCTTYDLLRRILQNKLVYYLGVEVYSAYVNTKIHVLLSHSKIATGYSRQQAGRVTTLKHGSRVQLYLHVVVHAGTGRH